MKSSDAIVKCLEKEKINMVFGYPGGAVLPLYESLRNSNIKHILVRHEQSAAHSASGYARSSRKVGVCIGTSGPGATNLITGIATAYMDSIPLIIITGQVKSTSIGKDVFQEADIIGSTESFTKHNYLIKNPNDIPKVIKESLYIASSGRPGPVLIDIPVDIQNEIIKFYYPENVSILGYKPTYKGHIGQIKRALRKLKNSKKPLICAGGGIISADASKELQIFSEKFNIPVVHTLMGIGSIPSNSPYYAGMVGCHGNSCSNKVVTEADLLIIIGARLTDRAASCFKSIDENTNIIHIDIDPAEVGKNIDTNIPIIGDAKNILQQLIELSSSLETYDWINRINALKKVSCDEEYFNSNFVNPKKSLKILSNIVDEDTIVTADVGQNQIWTANNFEVVGNRKLFTSGGLGTMGYSLPAAVGAKLASPDKNVICVVGDAGIQMCLSELGTISENNLNIIIILFNNSILGMVKELQDMAYGKGSNFGVQFKNPNFVKIAQAYDLCSKIATSDEEFEDILKEALQSKTGYLIECIVDSNFSTL